MDDITNTGCLPHIKHIAGMLYRECLSSQWHDTEDPAFADLNVCTTVHLLDKLVDELLGFSLQSFRNLAAFRLGFREARESYGSVSEPMTYKGLMQVVRKSSCRILHACSNEFSKKSAAYTVNYIAYHSSLIHVAEENTWKILRRN